MDYGMFSPEVNSGRMYAGPGAASLSAAASAWAQLADELYAAAGAYQSVVAELTAGPWSGPASASMMAAAIPYAEWLSATAAQVEQTAAQATAAVAAYEAAFAATVPPPVIAANRGLLAALVATNFFGQNTPAIAAAEAHYAEMWAQDAAAMYIYAASSAASTVLTPPRSPRQNTTPGGPAGQAAAVSQAVGTPAGHAQAVVSGAPHTLSAVPDALQSLAAAAPVSAQPTDPLTTLAELITIFVSMPSGVATLGVLFPEAILDGAIDFPVAVVSALVGYHTDAIVSGWDGLQVWPGNAPAPVTDFPATLTNLSPGTVPTVSAGLAEAKAVGALSVPPSWTVAAPELRPAALSSPLSESAAAAPVEMGSSTALSNVGLSGMIGRAMGGPPSGGGDGGKVTGQPVVARVGNAAPDGDAEPTPAKPRIVVTGVAARIREITQLRDDGRLTAEEYEQLKKNLLGR